MRVLRTILFYLFLAIYLVATPTAILYALGYLYKPGADRGLLKYGLISIASTPDDAQVFLGDSRYTRRTPTVLRDLVPGTYFLRLARRDHEAWQGEVEVQPERARVMDRIILLPTAREPRLIDARRWSDLVAEPGEERVLLVADGPLAAWTVLDATEGARRALLPTNSPWADARAIRHWQTPGNPHLLIEVRHEDRDAYLWFSLQEKNEPPLDITRLFPEPPDDVLWDRRARREIYARIGARVNRIDTKENAIYPDIAPPARGLSLHRSRLHVLTATNDLVRVDRDGEATRTDYRIPSELAERLNTADGTPRLLGDDLLLIHGKDGALRVNTTPWTLAESGVQAILPDSEESRWLVVGRRTLGLLEHRERDEEETPAFALRWIHEHPDPIERAMWLHDDTHILFSSAGQLWLLALERGGGGPPRAIAALHANGAFFFSERSGDIYLLDTEHRLAALRILPPRSLIPLPRRAEEPR